MTSLRNENEEIINNFVTAINECNFEIAANLVHDDFKFMEEWIDYIKFYKNLPSKPLTIDNRNWMVKSS